MATDKTKAHENQPDTPQLALFEIVEAGGKNAADYSSTIEIYDALPKYVWESSAEMENPANAVITRRCKLRGIEYTIDIKPAIIKRKDGTTFLAYPGMREELVEDALRKLAVNGQAKGIQGKVGVVFTMYELQKELQRSGHGYNLNEIKEALEICRGTSLEIAGPLDQELLSSNIFPLMGLTKRNVTRTDDVRCFVQFHPLVNQSINSLTFRQYNYKIGMEIKSLLARYMFKRMSHYWTQAAPNKPYTPSLISFLEQSPRPFSAEMRMNVRAMKNALEELIKRQVVSHYNATNQKDGKKIVNVSYEIYPHSKFVSEIIKANETAKKVKANIGQERDIELIEQTNADVS